MVTLIDDKIAYALGWGYCRIDKFIPRQPAIRIQTKMATAKLQNSSLQNGRLETNGWRHGDYVHSFIQSTTDPATLPVPGSSSQIFQQEQNLNNSRVSDISPAVHIEWCGKILRGSPWHTLNPSGDVSCGCFRHPQSCCFSYSRQLTEM